MQSNHFFELSRNSTTTNILTVDTIHRTINHYKKNRGWGRFMFGDQATMQILETFYYELLSKPRCKQELNAREAFTVINLIVNNESSKKNSASSNALELIYDSCRELIKLCALLKFHNCFNFYNFSNVYNRFNCVDNIIKHLEELSKIIFILPSYVEVICEYTEKYNYYLVDIIAKFEVIGIIEEKIIKLFKLLLKEENVYSESSLSQILWSKIHRNCSSDELIAALPPRVARVEPHLKVSTLVN